MLATYSPHVRCWGAWAKGNKYMGPALVAGSQKSQSIGLICPNLITLSEQKCKSKMSCSFRRLQLHGVIFRRLGESGVKAWKRQHWGRLTTSNRLVGPWPWCNPMIVSRRKSPDTQAAPLPLVQEPLADWLTKKTAGWPMLDLEDSQTGSMRKCHGLVCCSWPRCWDRVMDTSVETGDTDMRGSARGTPAQWRRGGLFSCSWKRLNGFF